MATATPDAKKAPADPNVYAIGDDLRFAALGDRILIEEDPFRSGYECAVCSGSGRMPCNGCNGSGKSRRTPNARCGECEGAGSHICQECGGKGGLLVAPEVTQRRPTTGRIVSIGEACKHLKVGQSVLFSNFAGYVIDLERAGHNITLRIIHETEVLCKIEGHLELRSLRGKSEIATFQS